LNLVVSSKLSWPEVVQNNYLADYIASAEKCKTIQPLIYKKLLEKYAFLYLENQQFDSAIKYLEKVENFVKSYEKLIKKESIFYE
jgi:hypothetical protein